ncbi:MAG: hypothetical protein ACOY3X_08560 [Pseudomonadota bacterium]
MKVRSVCVAALALALAGCATNYAAKPPEAIARAVQIKDSAFDAAVTYVGPRLQTKKTRGIFTDYQYAQLRSIKDRKTGSVKHQLYIQVNYTGSWRYYQVVSFKNGHQEALSVIGRDVSSCTGIGCMYTETLGVDVTEEQLLSGGNSFEVRISSKSGHENIVALPENYVTGYFSAIK